MCLSEWIIGVPLSSVVMGLVLSAVDTISMVRLGCSMVCDLYVSVSFRLVPRSCLRNLLKTM